MNDSEKTACDALVNDTLREMMSASEDYMFVKDAELVYHVGSEAFAHMAGLGAASELIGKTDLDIFARDIAEKYRADDRRVLESGEPIGGMLERLPDLDGKQRWTRTWKRAIRDSSGRIIGLYGIGRDVSGEVMLKERVRTAEDYMGLINNIPCGVAILHEENGGFYLDLANAGFMEVHHHSDRPVDALTGLDVLPYVFESDRPRIAKEYERIRNAPDAVGSVDYRFAGSDGKSHWCNVRLRFAYVKNGISFYYAVCSGLDTQKKTEEGLEESRIRLEDFVRNTDLQFFTYFPGRSRCENLILNSRFSRLPTVWDRFPDDFLEYTQCPAEDAKLYRAMLDAINRGDAHAECVVRFVYRGSYIWEKISMKSVRGSDGSVVRAQGYSIDVTAQKSAEELLRKERVRLKTMDGGVFESFSFNLTKASQPQIKTRDEAMLKIEVGREMLDEAFRICPALEATNPETRAVLLKAAARIPDPRDRELFISACSGKSMLAGVKDGHYSAEIRYRRQVGAAVRWVQTNAEVLPDPENGDLIAFYYTKDINDAVEKELITSEIVGKNYACVSCLDLQSGVFSIISGTDRELRGLNGMQYSDMLREAANRFVAKEDADEYERSLSLDNVTDMLSKSKYYTVFNRRRETAEELPGKPLRRMKNDIFYLDGHRDAIVFLLSDVTAVFEQERESREKLETALISAKQASSAKSNFLSRMSHEIRTPLNAIIGMDAIAAQSIGNQEKTSDCIAKIGLSARYLLSLINDILDMSRIESGKMLLKNDSFSFPEFISNVNNIIYPQVKRQGRRLRMHGIRRGRRLLYRRRDQAAAGAGQRARQRREVHLQGPDLARRQRIAAGKRTRRKLTLRRQRYRLRDRGRKISEAHLRRFRAGRHLHHHDCTAAPASGLAITKNLVGLMGGMVIAVRSIVGVGSEFTIDVPLDLGRRRPRLPALKQPVNLQRL
jgi:two-component system sensor histidine kinase/response regulator